MITNNIDWDLILLYSRKYYRNLEIKLKNDKRVVGKIININKDNVKMSVKDKATYINFDDIKVLNYM